MRFPRQSHSTVIIVVTFTTTTRDRTARPAKPSKEVVCRRDFEPRLAGDAFNVLAGARLPTLLAQPRVWSDSNYVGYGIPENSP